MKVTLTYGTFDLMHYGHLEIFRRAKELADGGPLIVGVSTDEFNSTKGKISHMPYGKRRELVEAIRYVDKVIPEEKWDQKKTDIQKYGVDLLVMGDDWRGHFDELKEVCEVVYLPRTPDISSTSIKVILDAQRQKIQNSDKTGHAHE